MAEVKTYRFIISGGGTGGHVYPALAVAHELRSRFGNPEILFVGAKGKMEMTKVPENGFKIIGLSVVGIQRNLSFRNLLLPFKLLSSLFKARKIIREFQPDVAIGFGGYASAPVLWVASRMGVPTIIQEQNSYAGIANRLLGKRAKVICVAYEEMEKYFPQEKIIITGNPVRTEIGKSVRQEGIEFFDLDPDKMTLLILGGSLGARSINEGVMSNFSELSQSGFQVIWQTGQFYYNEMARRVESLNSNAIKIHKFLDRIDLAYSVADVVVSRAGALTIAEICAAGKAAVLVPSPNVAEDHQTKNAEYLVKREAAILVPDKNASEQLAKAALELMKNTNRREALEQNARRMSRPDATKEIVEQIIKVLT